MKWHTSYYTLYLITIAAKNSGGWVGEWNCVASKATSMFWVGWGDTACKNRSGCLKFLTVTKLPFIAYITQYKSYNLTLSDTQQPNRMCCYRNCSNKSNHSKRPILIFSSARVNPETKLNWIGIMSLTSTQSL